MAKFMLEDIVSENRNYEDLIESIEYKLTFFAKNYILFKSSVVKMPQRDDDNE
jgi:hypothetical protein